MTLGNAVEAPAMETMAKISNDNPQDLAQMSLGGIVADLPAVRALPGTRLVNGALQCKPSPSRVMSS